MIGKRAVAQNLDASGLRSFLGEQQQMAARAAAGLAHAAHRAGRRGRGGVDARRAPRAGHRRSARPPALLPVVARRPARGHRRHRLRVGAAAHHAVRALAGDLRARAERAAHGGRRRAAQSVPRRQRRASAALRPAGPALHDRLGRHRGRHAQVLDDVAGRALVAPDDACPAGGPHRLDGRGRYQPHAVAGARRVDAASTSPSTASTPAASRRRASARRGRSPRTTRPRAAPEPADRAGRDGALRSGRETCPTQTAGRGRSPACQMSIFRASR